MLRYKSAVFPQEVFYAETYDKMEELAKYLRKEEGEEPIMGFDTEMIDSRVSRDLAWGVPESKFMPTIMIQFATTKRVYIFHFHSTYIQQSMPPTLRRIIRSDKIIKVGLASHNDSDGLLRTFGTGVVQLLDIRAMGAAFGFPLNSLQDVAKWCTKYVLDKESPHDWCRSLQERIIRHEELEYAALDAIVCLEGYRALRSLFTKPTPIPPSISPGANSTIYTKECVDRVLSTLHAVTGMVVS